MRVTVLGATGLGGEELLQILGEREFPVGELRCFGSSDDSGDFGAPAGLEFRGSEVVAEPTDASRIADSDLVFCAAPGALEPLLPAIRESGAALVDLDEWSPPRFVGGVLASGLGAQAVPRAEALGQVFDARLGRGALLSYSHASAVVNSLIVGFNISILSYILLFAEIFFLIVFPKSILNSVPMLNLATLVFLANFFLILFAIPLPP